MPNLRVPSIHGLALNTLGSAGVSTVLVRGEFVH